MEDMEMEEEKWESPACAVTVTRKLTSTGARITTEIKQESNKDSEWATASDSKIHSTDLSVKDEVSVEEKILDSETPKFSLGLSDDEQSIVKAEPLSQISGASSEMAVVSAKKMSFDDFLKATNTNVMSEDECVKIERAASLENEPNEAVENQVDGGMKKEPEECVKTQLDAQFKNELNTKTESDLQMVPWEDMVKKEEVGENVVEATPLNWAKPRLTFPGHDPGFEQLGQKPVSLKKKVVDDRSLSCVVIEDGDLLVDEDWLLVGGSVVNGLSTTKGRKLEINEVVHFTFSTNLSAKNNTQWIVRFSTKRNGEIGRLPMEWAKCVIPLVNSGRVKVFGRSIDVPKNLCMMQEILLYISFYVHNSVFVVEGDMSSWKLDAPMNIDTTTHPLLCLFQLLSVKPSQEAQFRPEELDSRKRLLNPQVGGAFPQPKRTKGAPKPPPAPLICDEQTISESYLNKLVGATEMYDLQEMEPPSTLMCDLKPYQKQALFWMTEAEKGVDINNAAKTLHPCWAEYRVCDQRASSPIYVNIFSGEATSRFPAAMEMSRGGILADAMGLGKTVMTIALILARNGRGIPHDCKSLKSTSRDDGRAKGGTLIICPMALLSQWKDEFETHSAEYTLSIFVHYGGGRTEDPRLMSGYDVVLTTYGILQSSYKNYGDQSIYNRVEWHRVVLDEAHVIKCSRTQCAQAAFSLSSHCRWCLTGTPLQNNLEDLYSLLCFLHVEPWCNWAWWNKLIQRPYENGDHRGLKLVKSILRPLMLRRTKETKDKYGRPILVLPPTDIQTIECEQSEAEHDFYDALFRKSKVEFDQFVAAGKALHNYCNILELLLRLRQCCNHPFLVMSKCDTQKYADLNKLAKNFINEDPNSACSNQLFPSSSAYADEVVETLKKGKNTECPICLESPDDPVLTSCSHVMCRECLLTSWGNNTQTGLCPLCRQLLQKTDLITCPAESRFRLDVEKNWKESSKVSKLLNCLEKIRRSGSREKSIVFSQWTSFLDLLEIPMKRNNIGYLRFDGSLSQKHRECVLREFNESNHKMVLLMSLRAGGVGLNLTAASNVFLLDPWWNPAVEEQAIMRIHRIGQKHIVCVRRFIVKSTVEERLQQVQARKERMIAGALTDDEVRSARLEELKMLFR